jgi:nitroreductase
MNEVMKCIYGRRSVRNYTDESLDEERLKEIIKAGTFAPNGNGVDPLRFVIITNKDKMKGYSDIAKKIFIEYLKAGLADAIPEKRTGIEGLIAKLGNPAFNIFYNAPSLVLVFAAPVAFSPVEDGALAAENMMLAAQSMGIGSCWIGFASPLGASKDMMEEFGVPMDHKLIAPIIFGYPKKEGMSPSKRNEPHIFKWIN